MKLRTLAITIEAVMLGGPITYLAILALFPGLFLPFMTAIIPLDWNGVGFFMLCGGTFLALSEYWHLAYATAIDKPYEFGMLFWAAISGALGAIYLSFEFELYRSSFILLTVIAIMASTFHFIYLQAKRGNSLCPTRHSSGTA